MPRPIDPKYQIEDNQIVKVITGEAIPLNEPLILFRARDRHALAMLHYYRLVCVSDECTDFHIAGIDNRIKAFQEFARQHPESMKQPGCTRGL